MIPQTIHQIFWNFHINGGKELDEIDVFRESVDETKRYCEEYDYQYKMWSLKDCEELICEYYPQYICLWNEFRFDIQRCDFIRYLILYRYGGWYVDCDVYPIQDLSSMSHYEQVFTSWASDKKRLPYNAVMGSQVNNELFIKICDDIILRVLEKQSEKIYDTWRGRLVFQTTGHHMLRTHIDDSSIFELMMIYNKKKKIFTTSDNPYFYDHCASLWY